MNNLRQLFLTANFYLEDYDGIVLNSADNTQFSYACFLTGRVGASHNLPVAYAAPMSGIFFCPSNRTPDQMSAVDVTHWARAVYGLVHVYCPVNGPSVPAGTYPGQTVNLFSFRTRRCTEPSGHPMFSDSIRNLNGLFRKVNHVSYYGTSTVSVAHMIHNNVANMVFLDGHVEGIGPENYLDIADCHTSKPGYYVDSEYNTKAL